jgi:hypothetical protein
MGAATKHTAVTIATIKTVFLLMFISFGYEFTIYQSGIVPPLFGAPVLNHSLHFIIQNRFLNTTCFGF